MQVTACFYSLLLGVVVIAQVLRLTVNFLGHRRANLCRILDMNFGESPFFLGNSVYKLLKIHRRFIVAWLNE
jgi:hypothetical protein